MGGEGLTRRLDSKLQFRCWKVDMNETLHVPSHIGAWEFFSSSATVKERKASRSSTCYVRRPTYIKDPSQALTSQTTQGVFVPRRLEDLEHHFALNHF